MCTWRSKMNPEERFFQFVEKGNQNECWLWTGGRSNGKGGKRNIRRAAFWINGTTMHASRAAWIIFRGDPEDRWVLHTCDNHLCVNPNHLYLGDRFDNAQDRVNRSPNSFVKGEAHSQAKLTGDDVSEIKNKYKPHRYSQQRLANEYGVTRTTIQQIVEGRSWRHIE